MARHSSGQSNFTLSKSLTFALITILVIIALILWWVFSDRSDDSTDQADGTTGQATTAAEECIQGDLALPIGGDPAAVEAAVEQFNADNPTTRDYCVNAEPAESGEPAAVYLFAGSRGDAAQAFAETGAVPAGTQESWSQVDPLVAGIAAAQDAPTDLDNIRFPVADQPTVSAAVALALSEGDEDSAATALAEDAQTTVDAATASPAFAALESAELPSGHTFKAVDGADIPVWVVPVNASGDITEDQARAGADFTTALASDSPVDDAALTSVIERAMVPQEEEDTPPVVSSAPSDTLIVLDTSTNMDQVVGGSQESYHTVTSNILSELARETGGMGNQVALNNYSSPLNPGVSRGWRPNVSFPDTSGGNNAANAIDRFGTGGVPLTRAAAVAAATIGSEHAAASGRDVRVVLVTTGSASDYSDEGFLADLSAAAGDKVSLHVVHVGSGEVDRALAGFAMANGGSAVTAANIREVTDTLRAAFGF